MATMREVAARAHVSAKTASLVFNDDPHVSLDTKQCVAQALRELNYVPNSIATTFRTGRAPVIGVAVPEIADPFFASIAEAAETLAAAHDVRHRVAKPPEAVGTCAMPPQLCGQARDACWHGVWIVFEGRPSPPEGVP